MRHLEEGWEIPDLELPTEEQYQDHMMAIEGEVLHELEEEVAEDWISAEECEAIYAGWMKKYRHTHHRPPLQLPDPPEAA